MTEYCPHLEKCPFYKNWVEQTGDSRIDVIVKELNMANFRYNCLTLIALDDLEVPMAMNEELSNRLNYPKETKCSHITLLNLLNRFQR